LGVEKLDIVAVYIAPLQIFRLTVILAAKNSESLPENIAG